MKNLLPSEPCGPSETYHGAKMNQKALDFHTHLHEWNEAQTLVTKHTQLLTANRPQDNYLPIKKLAHIEYWAKQVNKYYLPNKAPRPRSGSFMKIDVSKYKMKLEKNREIKRSKSAYIPSKRLSVTPNSQYRPSTSARRQFFGTNMHSVQNNIVESQAHYSAQRSDLYSPTKYTVRKIGTGENGESEPVELVVSEGRDYDDFDNESQSVTVLDLGDGGNVSEIEAQGQDKADIMQPHIVARSTSNRMLNVISIDDCKLTCRYRPQMIKESRKLSDNDDSTAKGKKVTVNVKTDRKEKKQKDDTVNGHEADDEAENSASSQNLGDVEQSLNGLTVNDAIVDSNNNMNACHEHNQAQEGSSIGVSEISGGKFSKSAKIKFNPDDPYHATADHRTNFSSRGTSKTSYGRLTSLNLKSEQSKPNTGQRQSRTSRINQAINGVVQGRKVMNSLERDFDTRTAQFGRTVIETSDGSETFKKIHANLRKKIDRYMDSHSAKKTRNYLEQVRHNSISNANNPST